MKNQSNNEKIINSITVEPLPIKKESKVIISYNGMLNDGTNKTLYMHYGYGKNDTWDEVGEEKMLPSPKGFTGSIPISRNATDRINLCFHDEIGNWDNNGGNNWCFQITE